jgi:hypothetical protein
MSFYCSRKPRVINPIKVVQNCYSDLGLTDLVVASGSIFNRSFLDDLGLIGSLPTDYYSEFETDSLSFVSQVSVARIIPTASILVINQNVSVAGGRVATTPDFYDVVYDPAALSNAQVGSWVYVNSSGNAILATSAGTLPQAEVVGCFTAEGIPSQLTELLTKGRLTLADWTALAGTEFLSPGVVYYLTTGGLMSAVAPSSGYVVVLGRAVTSTQFDVDVQLPWGVE